jgi:hypothetical protein
MNSLFLSVIFDSLTGLSSSRVIPYTLLTRGTKYTEASITEFDIALLKAIYSDEIEYGIDRKTAAEKISKLVYQKLRR